VGHGIFHLVGSPETVAAKTAANIRLLGLSRFDLNYNIGHLSQAHRAISIELYGREVITQVRELLAEDPVQQVSADQRAAAANAAGSRA
jgi:hypothetical protein